MSLSKALTAAAGNAGAGALYVEDVFSNYLYTGTGSATTITNGIDLAGEGGLVWGKSRTTNVFDHQLMDTERGIRNVIASNKADGGLSNGDVSAFNSDGFSLSTGNNLMLSNGQKFASFTFRKAEKFFDIQTWTGNGVAGRTIAHNLGVAPAVVILKNTSSAGTVWAVWHSSEPTKFALLNDTNSFSVSNAAYSTANVFGNNSTVIAPTSTEFTVGNSAINNTSPSTYVAYLFASEAGGFGDDGSENIIKCGSYTGSYTDIEIDCGFEPQWLLIKNTSTSSNWTLVDVMRGMPVAGSCPYFTTNEKNGDYSVTAPYVAATATGFTCAPYTFDINWNTHGFVYIAIRRPMKTPESGTEVFSPVTYSGNNTARTIDAGFPIDVHLNLVRNAVYGHPITTRMQGGNLFDTTSTAAAAVGYTAFLGFDNMSGLELKTGVAYGFYNSNANTYASYMFKRATGFMDVVCYTGDGVAGRTVNHNLGVAPELMIVKRRDTAANWQVYASTLGATKYLNLDLTNSAATSSSRWNDTEPTDTVFTTAASGGVNNSGGTFIAYLFATLAGVSKVGSYTGTGADLNIDCGFSAGARFILIKRTDATGDWHVWDSSRGISASLDPYSLINTTAAEITYTDYIDPLSSGFTVTSSAPAALNASGGSYIFLAIA